MLKPIRNIMVLLLSFGLSIIVFTATFSCAREFQYNNKSIRLLANTYGFIYNVEMSLDYIESKYPQLKIQVLASKVMLNSKFPNLELKLKKHLIKAAREEQVDDLLVAVKKRINELIKNSLVTKADAETYLTNLNGIVTGENIPADIFRSILAVQYFEKPIDELNDGFTQRYSTEKHKKSMGLNINLELPISWKGSEGERPHIVQKWSQSPMGLESILLLIQDSQGTIADKEFEYLVSSGSYHVLTPKGSKYLKGGQFSLENQKGVWLETTSKQTRIDIELYAHSITYYLPFNEKIISLMCSSVSLNKDFAGADDDFNSVLPLCKSVLNSMVIYNLYN